MEQLYYNIIQNCTRLHKFYFVYIPRSNIQVFNSKVKFQLRTDSLKIYTLQGIQSTWPLLSLENNSYEILPCNVHY